MAIYKVLLFYGFTPLKDPEAIRLWQRDLCESLGLGGRILISPQGINSTVGGELTAVKKYWRKTRDYPAFKSIDFKWSEGTSEADFPRLKVRVRDELVGFGVPDEVKVDEGGVIGGGQHLHGAVPDLHLARGQVGVRRALGPDAHGARHLHHVLAAEVVGAGNDALDHSAVKKRRRFSRSCSKHATK